MLGERFPCGSCGSPLPEAWLGSPDAFSCPGCGRTRRALLFPALLRPPEAAQGEETAPPESTASCYNHPDKRAVLPCDRCGRFLCALCDLSLDSGHICPACLESGQRKGKLRNLETQRVLYDNIALAVAVLPLLMIWPTLITAPLAIGISIRKWRAPSSLLPRTRVRFVVASALASVQLLGWGFVLVSLLAV